MADLERRLIFYEYRDRPDKKPFDRIAMSDAMTRIDPTIRAIESGAFHFDVVLVDPGTPETPTRLRIVRMRDYDNRPYVYAVGEDPVPVQIEPHQAISDIAHVILWPDGYAAIDQGGHAPPLSALRRFSVTRCGEWVDFIPLYDRQVVERLNAIKGRIRSIEVGIDNSESYQHDLDERLPAIRGFLGLLRGHRGVRFRTEVKVDRRGKGARSRTLPNDVAEQFLVDAERAEQLLDLYRVSGLKADGSRDQIDLISERLHVPAKLPRASGGGHLPDSEATYGALERAKASLAQRGALEAAARGVLDDPSG